MLTLLADVAELARQTHRSYFTGLTVKLAAQLDAARTDGRRSGGVAVVHDHEQITSSCVPTCQLVPPPPAMFGDPHR